MWLALSLSLQPPLRAEPHRGEKGADLWHLGTWFGGDYGGAGLMVGQMTLKVFCHLHERHHFPSEALAASSSHVPSFGGPDLWNLCAHIWLWHFHAG